MGCHGCVSIPWTPCNVLGAVNFRRVGFSWIFGILRAPKSLPVHSMQVTLPCVSWDPNARFRVLVPQQCLDHATRETTSYKHSILAEMIQRRNCHRLWWTVIGIRLSTMDHRLLSLWMSSLYRSKRERERERERESTIATVKSWSQSLCWPLHVKSNAPFWSFLIVTCETPGVEASWSANHQCLAWNVPKRCRILPDWMLLAEALALIDHVLLDSLHHFVLSHTSMIRTVWQTGHKSRQESWFGCENAAAVERNRLNSPRYPWDSARWGILDCPLQGHLACKVRQLPLSLWRGIAAQPTFDVCIGPTEQGFLRSIVRVRPWVRSQVKTCGQMSQMNADLMKLKQTEPSWNGPPRPGCPWLVAVPPVATHPEAQNGKDAAVQNTCLHWTQAAT